MPSSPFGFIQDRDGVCNALVDLDVQKDDSCIGSGNSSLTP